MRKMLENGLQGLVLVGGLVAITFVLYLAVVAIALAGLVEFLEILARSFGVV